ncbi:MAG: hypothetical protein HKN26_16350 [Acidimicrobiales bacterium]|nr:hypothetical protein [Acidimicrobiales bacterium]
MLYQDDAPIGKDDIGADCPIEGVPQDLPADLSAEAAAKLEELQPEIICDFRAGRIDEIPEGVVAALPESVQNIIPDSLVAKAGDNPTLALILVIVGILSVFGAIWGAIKGFLKMALILGVIAVAAWIWYFNGGG